MPLDIDFDLPFPVRLSPDTQAVEEPHISWLRSHGLLGNPRELEWYKSWRFHVAAGYVAPRARGHDDLLVVVDGVAWNGLFDNFVADHALRAPDRMARAIALCADITDGNSTTRHGRSAEPLVHMLEDLWPRLCAGMTQTWQHRMAVRMRKWFDDMQREVAQRVAHAQLTTRAYWEMRHSTLDLDYFVGLAERAEHYETPETFWHTPYRQDLGRAADTMVSIMNDVQSLEKEEQAGEPHNIVLIKERELGCSRADAVSGVLADLKTACARFVELEARLPTHCAELGFGPHECSAARHYATTLHNIAISTWQWGNSSGRYVPRSDTS